MDLCQKYRKKYTEYSAQGLKKFGYISYIDVNWNVSVKRKIYLIDLNFLISNSWKVVIKNHYFTNITSATIKTTIPTGICAVAQLVEVLSYNRKAAGSIPHGVTGIFL
jgi:hypothetical protein